MNMENHYGCRGSERREKSKELNLPFVSCQVEAESKRGSRKNNSCNVTKCTSIAGDVILIAFCCYY